MNNVEEDLETLKKIIKDKKEKDLITFINSRENSRLVEIREEYTSKYGKDLIKELKDMLSRDFEDLVVALFYLPEELDAKELKDNIKKEDVLTEIIGTRNNSELTKIKDKYKELAGKDLVEDVKKNTDSGVFQDLLLRLLECKRSEEKHPSLKYCEESAVALYVNGEGAKHKNDSEIISLFTKTSRNELKYITQYYYNKYNTSIIAAIDNIYKKKSDENKLFKAVLYGVLNPAEYFADKVFESVDGVGTDDKKLIRTIVSRREKDIEKMKKFYKQKHNKSLYDGVKGDTSGGYKDLLLNIIKKD